MQQVAEMLNLGLDSGDDPCLVFFDLEPRDELPPVDHVVILEVAVVEQKIDLFGGQGDVELPESLLELEIGDRSLLEVIGVGECLLEGFGTREQNFPDVIYQLRALVLHFVDFLIFELL